MFHSERPIIRHGRSPIETKVKKEWSITSAGLLSLCVGHGVLGWKREEQLRAAVVLNCLLVNIVEPSIERTLLPVRESVDLDVQQACEEYNVLYATCPHIAALHLSTCIAATPQSRIATGMLDAFKGMERCCSVKGVASSLLSDTIVAHGPASL